MLIDYLSFFTILVITFGFALQVQKFFSQLIIIQFLAFIAIIVSYFIYAPTFNIPVLSKVIDLSTIRPFFIFCMCYLMSQIIYESTKFKFSFKVVKFSLPSLLFPLICGFLVGYFYLNYLLSQAIVMGLVFSIIAIPVLYIYLKDLNYSSTDINFYLQSAILIDLVVWVVFALIKVSNVWYFELLTICLGMIPFTYKYIKINDFKKCLIFNILFFITFYFLELFKLNGLLFSIIFLFSMKNEKIEFWLVNSFLGKNFLQNHLIIPVIILYGLLQINLQTFQFIFEFNFLIFLIIIPIFSKIIGNYFSFIFIHQKPNLFDSVLLNTRGLTEIVFLNLIKSNNLINDKIYFYLILMSLVSTIIPGFIIEYKKKKI